MLEISKKTIKKLSAKELAGKKVLVRLDLNVPIRNGEIQETFRIDRAFPTLDYLQEAGAKLILVSHLGTDGEQSLRPVADYLNKHLRLNFVSDFHDLGEADFENGRAVLLENIRVYPGEIANNRQFAQELSEMADLYVNEAFSCSHRNQASIVGLPLFLPSYFGFLFEEEVKVLSRIFKPVHPFLFILGGAKFETKVPLLGKLLKIADQVYIYGAIANTFLQAAGKNVGRSVVDTITTQVRTFLKNKKVHLPIDAVIENAGRQSVRLIDDINDNDVIMDAGHDSVLAVASEIKTAKFILWNGPLGNFESGYGRATKDLAKLVAESDAFSVVGGGDTVTAIKDLGLENKIDFISTGGGAMLDFLAKGTLPGIEAIIKAKVKIKELNVKVKK